MKKRTLSILLIIVMVVCFGIAASYPIKYFLQKESNEMDMETLRAMRVSALDDNADAQQTPSADDNAGEETPPTGGAVLTDAAIGDSAETLQNVPEATPASTAAADSQQETAQEEVLTAVVDSTKEAVQTEVLAAAADSQQETVQTETSTAAADSQQETKQVETLTAVDDSQQEAKQAEVSIAGNAKEKSKGVPEATAVPAPTEEPIDRFDNEGYSLAYSNKEHVQFDESKILPQYREIYQMNNDLVGWLNIPGTAIDYPVVRNDDPEYYLKRNFFGERNSNGQLILDSACDPWTPSYNLVISGHNMKSGAMFAHLSYYASRSFWAKHKTFTFDTIMREGTYVVFAAFYSADYDEDEDGFRYNADIQYRLDAKIWLEDVMENAEYKTDIDVEFGDEFLTLTTCQYQRKNGRFVVVARRVREGEVIE